MKLKYEFKEYRLSDIINLIENKKLELPKFQRGFSWDDETQKKLIVSIMNGNPIGMILLAEMEGSENDSLVIIDGQQRLSTIKKYLESPLEFITEDIIDNDIIEEIIQGERFYSSLDDENKRRHLENWKKDILISLKKLIEKKIDDKIEADYKSYFILKKSELFSIPVEVNDNLTFQFVSSVAEKLELKDIVIPSTVYNGSIVELADLFEKVNSGSLPLTKYEILNAKWYGKKIKASNKVDELVREVYSSIEKEYSMNEDDFDAYTLFDFCLAINYELTTSKEYDFFYKKKNVGFEIISAVLSSFPNQIESLGVIEANLNEVSFGNFIDELHEALVDTANTMKKIYDKVLFGSKLRKHLFTTTYQQYHIFLSLFFKKYKLTHIIYSNGKVQQSCDFIREISNYKTSRINHELVLNDGESYSAEIKKIASKDIKSIDETILLRYMHMLCSDFYTKNRQISDFSNYISNESFRNIYFTTPSKDEFKNSTHAWLNEQLSNTKFFKFTIGKDVKQFAYIYHLLLIKNNVEYKAYAENYVNFDFDHIFPKSELKRDKVPVSCAQNIRLVDSSTNKKKSNNTFSNVNSADQTTNLDFLNLFGLNQVDIENFDKMKLYEQENKHEAFVKVMEERTEVITNKIDMFL